VPSDKELGEKSMEACELRKKPPKAGPKETHRWIGSMNNEPFWPPGAAEAPMALLIATGAPVL
jgi:hypothetical protein